ncbi:MAG TPA: hypothetical protein VGS21_00390, partial [Acidimicrobiales bacterium]|nr:hypothetical protein [Acidimicrobiales bacterium]
RSAEAAADRALAGHPIFAGLWSLDWPGTPYGDLWRAADLVREHRGDSHVAAWTSEGVDQVEISLLSELWWGLPPKSFIRTRGFGDEAIDPASDRLESRGLTKAGELTESGRELREAIERATERGSISIMEALGADAEELISLLEVWARAIIDAGAYAVDTIARSDDLSS